RQPGEREEARGLLAGLRGLGAAQDGETRQQQILEHAHVAEQSTDLKAAHQAASRNLVRLEPQQRASIEKNVAAVRRIEAGNEVDERRLAGAVRSDQSADLARRDRKIDAVG